MSYHFGFKLLPARQDTDRDNMHRYYLMMKTNSVSFRYEINSNVSGDLVAVR